MNILDLRFSDFDKMSKEEFAKVEDKLFKLALYSPIQRSEDIIRGFDKKSKDTLSMWPNGLAAVNAFQRIDQL